MPWRRYEGWKIIIWTLPWSAFSSMEIGLACRSWSTCMASKSSAASGDSDRLICLSIASWHPAFNNRMWTLRPAWVAMSPLPQKLHLYTMSRKEGRVYWMRPQSWFGTVCWVFFLFVSCFVNVFLFLFCFCFCFTSNLNVNKSVCFLPSPSKQIFTAASSTEIPVPSYSVPCLLLELVLFVNDAPQKKQNCSVCYLLMCQLTITH